MFKGQMIKLLKEKGIRHKDGQKLETLKTHAIAQLFDAQGLDYKDIAFFKK